MASVFRMIFAAGLTAACGSSLSPVWPDTDGGDTDTDAADAWAAKDALVAMADAEAGITGPSKLSETGLYSDFTSKTIDPQLLLYTPRYELWSDGAQKTRYLYLPPGTKIDTSDPDNWTFPVGMKMWKEFRVGGKLVETRLIQKTSAGTGIAAWWKVAYAWSADGSDAIAAPAGVPNALGTTHDIPSQQQCEFCHGNVADVNIGLGVIQASGGTLAMLGSTGRLTTPLADKEVPGTGALKDALAYLHANCGHCHNDVGWVHGVTDLQLRVPVSANAPTDSRAYGAVYLQSKHLLYGDAGEQLRYEVVPGRPEDSQLFYRMSRRDVLQMPPICTKVIDDTGVALVRSWILELPGAVNAPLP